MINRREFLELAAAGFGGIFMPKDLLGISGENLGAYVGGEVISKRESTYMVRYDYTQGKVVTMVDKAFWEKPEGKRLFDKVWMVGERRVRMHSQSDPRFGLYINSKGVLINTAEKGCGLMATLMAASMVNDGERIDNRTIVKAMEIGWGDAKETVVLSQPRLTEVIKKVFPHLLPKLGEKPNAAISLVSMWGPDFLLQKPTKDEEPDRDERERFNHWVLCLDSGVVVDQLLTEPLQHLNTKRSGNFLYKEIGGRIGLRL